MKKAMSILLAVLMVITAFPLTTITSFAATSGICGDNLTWVFDKTTGTLTISGTGDMYDCNIASRPWIDYEREIERLVIDDGVTRIGAYAFFECYFLRSITIGSDLETFNETAFFGNCNIQSIFVSENNQYFSNDENGVLFDKNGTTLVKYPTGSSNTRYIIPNTVTEIATYAFTCGRNLIEVSIPDSVTTIGMAAFSNCDNINSVTIPNSVTTLGNGVFTSCDNLVNVSIGNSIKMIDSSYFSECYKLTTVNIPLSVTSIEAYTFYDTSLSKVITPCNSYASKYFDKSVLDLQHDLSDWIVGSEPTCTKSGSKYKKCSVCDGTIDTESIPANGHTYGEWQEVVSPNCENNGLEKRICSVCKGEETREIVARGHDYSVEFIIDVEATCTNEGGKSRHCSRCDSKADETIIPATGHSFNNGYCIVCGIKQFTGWKQENGKWAYYVDGFKATNKWMKDSKGWCYLGDKGYMLTNTWVMDSVGWCYVGADGYCVTNCWKADSKGWCYLDSNGRMVVNNWVKDNGKWYFMDGNGYMVSNCWKKDSKGWCYLGSSGAMLTNAWVKDSVGWCYVGANGYCLTNQWKADSKGWCYLDSNGRMLTNSWFKDGGSWYYLDANGYMLDDGYAKVNNKIYYFYGNGKMLANEKHGSAYVSSNGEITAANFKYLVENDIRTEQRKYSQAKPKGAFIYIDFDSTGSFCVLTDVFYKLGSYEYDIATLHDYGRGKDIIEPYDYYLDLWNRGYTGENYNALALDAKMMEIYALQNGYYISY